MSHAHMVIEAFHRTDAEGTSVSFSGGIDDVDALEKELRAQRVYANPGATPVVVLLDDDGHLGGNCRGTVAVGTDSDRRLFSIELAIRALEDVRDGLKEAGHSDDQ